MITNATVLEFAIMAVGVAAAGIGTVLYGAIRGESAQRGNRPRAARRPVTQETPRKGRPCTPLHRTESPCPYCAESWPGGTAGR